MDLISSFKMGICIFRYVQFVQQIWEKMQIGILLLSIHIQ